jgi:hypothetical protein
MVNGIGASEDERVGVKLILVAVKEGEMLPMDADGVGNSVKVSPGGAVVLGIAAISEFVVLTITEFVVLGITVISELALPGSAVNVRRRAIRITREEQHSKGLDHIFLICTRLLFQPLNSISAKHATFVASGPWARECHHKYYYHSELPTG